MPQRRASGHRLSDTVVAMSIMLTGQRLAF